MPFRLPRPLRPFRALTAALLVRRTLRALDRLATASEAQTDLLLRLVDRLAPVLPAEPAAADRAQLRAETGISHLDVDEAEIALEFIARMESTTGHTPDEEEVLIAVADEQTRDLASRLSQREAEIARLMEARG